MTPIICGACKETVRSNGDFIDGIYVASGVLDNFFHTNCIKNYTVNAIVKNLLEDHSPDSLPDNIIPFNKKEE